MSRRCKKQLGIIKHLGRMGRNVKSVQQKDMNRRLKSWYQVNKSSYNDSKGQVNLRNPRIIT